MRHLMQNSAHCATRHSILHDGDDDDVCLDVHFVDAAAADAAGVQFSMTKSKANNQKK
jgi:hypothetical protein